MKFTDEVKSCFLCNSKQLIFPSYIAYNLKKSRDFYVCRLFYLLQSYCWYFTVGSIDKLWCYVGELWYEGMLWPIWWWNYQICCALPLNQPPQPQERPQGGDERSTQTWTHTHAHTHWLSLPQHKGMLCTFPLIACFKQRLIVENYTLCIFLLAPPLSLSFFLFLCVCIYAYMSMEQCAPSCTYMYNWFCACRCLCFAKTTSSALHELHISLCKCIKPCVTVHAAVHWTPVIKSSVP